MTSETKLMRKTKLLMIMSKMRNISSYMLNITFLRFMTGLSLAIDGLIVTSASMSRNVKK